MRKEGGVSHIFFLRFGAIQRRRLAANMNRWVILPTTVTVLWLFFNYLHATSLRTIYSIVGIITYSVHIRTIVIIIESKSTWIKRMSKCFLWFLIHNYKDSKNALMNPLTRLIKKNIGFGAGLSCSKSGRF